MSHARTLVGLGEALFDVFPDTSRLGGAPLNMAVHAQQLGNRGVVVSRIGQDALGDRVVRELSERGLSAETLQRDPDRPTGTVEIDFDDRGEPVYQIVEGVAWDALQWDPDVEDIAQRCDAVCFGSLAQRTAQTRNTIHRFLQIARRAVRLFDVNLRPPFYDRRILTRSLEVATAGKLNRGELETLTGLFHLGADEDTAAEGLRRKFDLRWVALTRGMEGVAVYTTVGKHEADPVGGELETGDRVGAGDAVTAALLHGAARRWPWERTLGLANHIGTHVGSHDGACPPLPDPIRRLAE